MRAYPSRFLLCVASALVGLPLAACGDDGVATDGDDTGSTTSDDPTSDTASDPTASASAESSSTDVADTSSGSATVETTGSSTAPADSSESDTSGDSTDGDSTGTGTDTSDTSSGGSSDESSSSSTGEMPTSCDGGTCVYVGASITNAAVVFDLDSGSTVTQIDLTPEASYPYDATIDPAGAEVWFVGATGDGVVVLDAATNVVGDQFSPSVPNGYLVDVAFGAGGTEAYVASRDTAALYVFDVASHAEIDVLATPNGVDAGKIALDPCTGFVHVVEWYGDALMTYDPAEGSWSSVEVDATVPGTSLWDLRVAPDGSRLYVADRSNDQIHVYDLVADAGIPSTPVASIDVGDDPWGIDITSDGATLVVACEDSRDVWFVDTAALTTTSLALALDADPRDVEITADDALAIVPTGDVAGADGVYVIDLATQTLAQTFTDMGASNSNVVAVTPQLTTCGAR